MPQTIHRGIKSLIDEANAAIETVSAADAIKAAQDPDVVIVDIRDPREIEREGKIPGAFSCTRGMLEFWIDPQSPYAKPIFQEDKKFIFHCAGGLRSALAAKTAQDMGLKPVAHMGGGFAAWRDAGGPVEKWEPKKKVVSLLAHRHAAGLTRARSRNLQRHVEDWIAGSSPAMTIRNDSKDYSMPTTTDPLVSTEWLAAHLNDPDVKVIDASFKMPGVLPLPKDDYLASHIPGAVFFDVDAVSDHSNPLPHMFPSAEQFGRDVGGLGIGNDDTVVLYDSGGWVAAPRVWWMFLSFGKDVRILNGGLKKWVAEGRKVEKGEVTPKPATFKATFDARRTRSMQQLVANLASRAEQVIDARANERYQGKVAEPRPGLRSGHIPGSLSLPYNNLFDAATGTMKSLDELRAAFSGAGVKLDAPIVTSCGSGVSAAVLTLALYRLGVENPALYDGSWTEWGAADGPPVATGPA